MLDGFEQSMRGNGKAFPIAAEAPTGRSRFLYEFGKAVAYENITFLAGKCLSYGRGMAYHPLIAILKANFHVQGGDRDQDKCKAEDWIAKAVATAACHGRRLELAKSHTLYAELFKRKGDLPKAREQLSKAIETFKECGADGWVRKTEEELDKLS